MVYFLDFRSHRHPTCRRPSPSSSRGSSAGRHAIRGQPRLRSTPLPSHPSQSSPISLPPLPHSKLSKRLAVNPNSTSSGTSTTTRPSHPINIPTSNPPIINPHRFNHTLSPSDSSTNLKPINPPPPSYSPTPIPIYP